MRESPHSPRWKASSILLAVIGVVYVLELILLSRPGGRFVTHFFLIQSDPWYFWIWQVFTFQFFHSPDNVFHVLLNGIGLFMFGRFVEASIGERNFLVLYFSSGVIGGIAELIFGFLMGRHDAYIMGASAGVFGLVGAFSVLNWSRFFTVLLYFIIPVRICGKYLFFGSAAISIFFMVTQFTNVAEAAHLGGLLSGAAFLYFNISSKIATWPIVGDEAYRRTGPRIVDVKPIERSFWKKPKPTFRRTEAEEVPPSEFISREVDPILDKIAQHGIHSLTDRERKILEAARSKMSGR